MAEKSDNKKILEDSIKDEQALIDAGLKRYGSEKEGMDRLADKGADIESKGAKADVKAYLQPGGAGIQADALSRLGLSPGRLSETNRSAGYNAYQSRIAAARNEARKAKEQYQLGYDMAASQAEADKANTLADWYNDKNADHWKTKQWEYQKAADTKADEEKAKAEAEAKAAQEAWEKQMAAMSGGYSFDYNYDGYSDIDDPEDPSASGEGQGGGGGSSWGEPSDAKAIKIQNQFMQEASDLYTLFNGKIPANYMNDLINRAKNSGVPNIDTLIRESFS